MANVKQSCTIQVESRSFEEENRSSSSNSGRDTGDKHIMLPTPPSFLLLRIYCRYFGRLWTSSQERHEAIAAWATQVRAHALGVAKVGVGEGAWMLVHLRAMSDLASTGRGAIPPCARMDFVAAGVGLRATAKSFLNEFIP